MSRIAEELEIDVVACGIVGDPEGSSCLLLTWSSCCRHHFQLLYTLLYTPPPWMNEWIIQRRHSTKLERKRAKSCQCSSAVQSSLVLASNKYGRWVWHDVSWWHVPKPYFWILWVMVLEWKIAIYISKIAQNTLCWRGSERGKKNLRGGELWRERTRELEGKVKFPISDFPRSWGHMRFPESLKVVSGI